jgi:hypothetical protein
MHTSGALCREIVKAYVDVIASAAARLRHSGAMPTGPRKARPDDRLRIEPGIQGFPDAQLRI